MAEAERELTEEEQLAQLLGGRLSEVVRMAGRILERAGAYSVLCPACGPGESSAYLARRGFRVTAYDISERAVAQALTIAEQMGVSVDCFVDDLIVPRRRLRRFDALFASNLLHQMLAPQRQRLLRSFHRALRQGGVLIVSVLSADDERYGYGRPVEEDTFELGLGETIHFYTVPELHEELSRFFQVAHVEDMEEVQEHYVVGKQTYRLLVATALRIDPD